MNSHNVASVQLQEIQCKTALGKCGFPGGGFAINPYVGCSHRCAYCYARFMKRFSGHDQDTWGTFVDARINVAEALEKQLKKFESNPTKNKLFGQRVIYVGTVTDPYQPIEKDYQLTRQIVTVLSRYHHPVSILTKSDLIVRDLDLLEHLKNVTVNITINTLDELWASRIEPGAPPIANRFHTARVLAGAHIDVNVMMGPYWPFFTNVEELFQTCSEVGVKKIFSESLNTMGGNWIGVEQVLKTHYPQLLPPMKKIFFQKASFDEFYGKVRKKMEALSLRYHIPIETFYGMGHAGKFAP